MKIKIIILCLLLTSFKSISQYQINPEIRSHAVLIETQFGSGSAFYVQDSLSIYLVTAYHVLFNLNTNSLISDTLIMISYRQDVETDRKDSFKVSLVSALKTSQLMFDKKNDVAVIKLAQMVPLDTIGNATLIYPPFVKRTGPASRIIGWPIQFSQTLSEIVSGSDIYIVGFPRSLGLQGKFDLDRPLFRKGIIAGKDYSYQRIIGDGAVYFGNSGGMVISLAYDNKLNNFQFKLIGLISEYIPYDDILYDNKMNPRSVDYKNSGYSVIIPLDFILPVIKKIK